MLRIENASFSLSSQKTLFRNLHLELKAGEILQVVGANGIGKSSFLKILAGIVPLTSGQMHWSSCVPEICYLPQLANLTFPIHLKMRDVLEILLLTHYNEKSVLELGFLNAQSLELSWNFASGGERQRTLLSWVFLSSAKLLLLDEPTNHLDRETSALLFKRMDDFLEKKDKAIVFVNHKVLGKGIPSLELGDFR